jgi:hypothetical protein
LFFACAGLELARYFTLIGAVRPLLTTSIPQLIRLLAAPNLLFAVAFFFLGIDAKAYSAYRPLLLVGKALALFSGAISLPGLLGASLDPSSGMTGMFMIVGILVWDAVSATLLAFLLLKPQAEAIPDPPSIASPDSAPPGPGNLLT